MSVVDHITSFVDGRVRLRHPALKDAATAELVCSVVGAVEGITSVQANPVTGSLLIYYDAEKLTREQLIELAEQGAAFIPGMEGEGAPAEAAAESAEQPLSAGAAAIMSGAEKEAFDRQLSDPTVGGKRPQQEISLEDLPSFQQKSSEEK